MTADAGREHYGGAIGAEDGAQRDPAQGARGGAQGCAAPGCHTVGARRVGAVPIRHIQQ
jgi:hypothetical protein